MKYLKELLATLKSIDHELKKQNHNLDGLINHETVGRYRTKTYIHTKHYKEGTV